MSVSPTVLYAETHIMDSARTGRQYRITVSLPYSYQTPSAEGWPFPVVQKWPVVFLLDANWYFGMVTDMVRSMAWCGGTRDAIVVGIGYPASEDAQDAWMEAFARRNADFTAVRDMELENERQAFTKRPVQTGDAERFHQFIRDELIPFVEHNYRVDASRRILAGHSRGANFAAYALFEDPALFNSFIIASCGPSDEDRYIFKREEAYAKAHKTLATRVFLSAGELEEEAESTTVTDTLRLAAVLESRKYEGLSLVKRVFPELNHCEVIAPSFQAGLKFALTV